MITTKTVAQTAMAAFVCAAMASCDSDVDAESRMPVMGSITFDKTEVSAGDTIKATLSLTDPGEYVKVKYVYAASPAAILSGSFECGSSQNKASFDIVIPETANDLFDKTDDESMTVTVTVAANRVTSYVGNQLYLDPEPMESKTQTFTLIKK